VVKQVLGDAFGGVVCCDRWTAYAFLMRRQFCWARLLRDFTAMVERFGSPWHGQQLVACLGGDVGLRRPPSRQN